VVKNISVTSEFKRGVCGIFGTTVQTSISANADGQCDAALCRIDHIQLPTE